MFFKKPLLALIFSLLVPLFFSAVALATPKDSGVQVFAEIGWEGRVVPGKNAPAVVRLKNNTTRNLNGTVEVINYYQHIPPPPPGSPPGAKPAGPTKYYPVSSFGEHLFLPAGGEKKVIFWFPLEGTANYVTVCFRTEKEVMASVKVKFSTFAVNEPSPLAVGVLGQVPPALEKVRLTMPDGVPRAPLILKLNPELFPATEEELDAFGVILLTGEAVPNLTAAQRRALAAWTTTVGGHLVLAGGLGINKTLTVLPPELGKITCLEVINRSNWQTAAGWLGQPTQAVNAPVAKLKGEGEPLGPQKEPLGWQLKAGNGKVTVFVFDPARPPWDAGALGKALWEKLLLPVQREYFQGPPSPYFNYYYNWIGHVNHLPAGAFPDWRLVGVFLVVFLITAGPLTYLILRKKQRPEYTWLVVPLLAIIFSSVTYVYMLQTGKNVITNIIQAADTTEDKSQNTAFTVVGFFTPTKPVFTAALADPGRPVKVQSFSGIPPEFWKPVKEPSCTVIRGTDLTVTFRKQSQWSMRSLAFYQDTEGVLDGLIATLELENNRLTGRVRNNTSLALEHVTLLLGNDYRCLGNLAGGQEKQVSLPLPVPPTYNPRQPSSRPGYFPVWQIFIYPNGKEEVLKAFRQLKVKGSAGPYPPPDYYGPPPRRLNMEEQRRANILENWLNSKYRDGPGAELQSGWPLTLFAFSQEPLSEVKIKDLRAKPQYLSVILRKPKLVLPKGNFLIPAGLVIPKVIGSGTGGMFGHNNLFGLDGGSLTYIFRPGLPEGIKIKEITVNLPYFPGISLPGNFKGGPVGPPSPHPAPVKPGVLEIYNPRRGQWQELAGSSLFRLGAEYAMPGGEVRLRVNGFSQNSKNFFYFLPPTVVYQGVKE
ncbi:MAG: hypothetical protein STSR0004_21430 [Peptococcaceae bacterium]